MFTGSSKKKQRGFTLIEIMVVVVIIGILAAFVVPKIMSRPDEARVIKAKQDIRTIVNQLNLYKLDNYRYPSTDEGIKALVEKPAEAANWKQGGYLDKMPKDPWERPYLYLQPGEHAEIDVYTLGRDGQPGGEGPDADLGNWDL
jgi:general secretion pathway protein G